MEFPFELNDDKNKGFRNIYNIVPSYPDVLYMEVYQEYICGYDPVQDYYSYFNKGTKTFIDTRFVNEISNFIWVNLETNHSQYYIGKPRTETGKEILRNLNRKSIELHTLIAILADIPNPDNYLHVDHNSHSSDNRTANLKWSSSKPYKLRYGNPLPYPEDVDKSEMWVNITWHVTNETGPNGEVVHYSFFKVGHPHLREKIWVTSKSNKFTNQEKLDMAKKKIEEFRDTCPIKKRFHEEIDKFNELIDEYEQSV